MRRALMLMVLLEAGCARPTITIADPDLPREYVLHLHDHDLLCAIDPSAPGLQACMTFAEFQGFLHSVRAEAQ